MKSHRLLLCFLLWGASHLAWAGSQGFTRLTLEGKLAKLGSNENFGWLTEASSRWYLGTSPISFGLGACFGSPTGNPVSSDYLVYAGFPLHVDGNLSKVVVYDIGIMAGYSMGSLSALNIQNNTGWVLEESLAIGLVLGKGWRLSFSPGYLYSFSNSNFTGFTFGIRLERKTLTAWSGFDN